MFKTSPRAKTLQACRYTVVALESAQYNKAIGPVTTAIGPVTTAIGPVTKAIGPVTYMYVAFIVYYVSDV